MKYLLNILFLLLTTFTFGQIKINTTLKKQLDSIKILDQKYRVQLMQLRDSIKKDSIVKSLNIPENQVESHLWRLQNSIDSSNVIFIENVFKTYGYPGKSLVDTPTNEVAWYIIQHSDKIHQYINLIREAGKRKDLPFKLVAMMEDRHLMDQGKEQIYGTQGTCRPLKTGKTECFIWPVKDPKTLNKRRKKTGFDTTIEEYDRKLMNIEYKIILLSEIK